MHLLGVSLESWNAAAARAHISSILKGERFVQVATVNPEFLVCAAKDSAFRALLNECRTPVDGVGITLISRLLYGVKLHRITGVDLAELILEESAKKRAKVALVGGRGVAGECAKIMQKKYPNLNIVYAEDGDPNAVSEILKAAQPEVVLAAFGSPKQEYYLRHIADEIPSVRLGIGVGGTFDYWAGNAVRAPKWVRKVGLEWLMRLVMQPKRARRIFNAVVVFPWFCVCERLRPGSVIK